MPKQRRTILLPLALLLASVTPHTAAATDFRPDIFLNGKPIIAYGAFHFMSRHGIVERLRAEGYEIAPISP